MMGGVGSASDFWLSFLAMSKLEESVDEPNEIHIRKAKVSESPGGMVSGGGSRSSVEEDHGCLCDHGFGVYVATDTGGDSAEFL